MSCPEWISAKPPLKPRARTLTAYRHTAQGYLLVAAAGPADRLHIEPFDLLELRLDVLFDDTSAMLDQLKELLGG